MRVTFPPTRPWQLASAGGRAHVTLFNDWTRPVGWVECGRGRPEDPAHVFGSSCPAPWGLSSLPLQEAQRELVHGAWKRNLRGERRHHRKQIDLITTPKTQGLPLDCADQETEVAQVWEGIGPGSHSQSTWGLPSSPLPPLQAMTILPLIMLALATGHVGGETRIIKGYECPPHSQPWQVVLFQKTRLLCGATLVAPKWLLTAAHCLKPQYIVHLGMHHLQRHDGWEQTRRATKSFPHPDFNNSIPNKDHRNDIMLVKLASPAIITWAVRPLTLSSRCVTPGTRCLISGWGTTSSPQLRLPQTLRCANITIIDHKECENAYPGNITNTMVCASVREEGKDSCQGDSGGPLVCNGSLQGIISWGQDPCAISRKPGVYTKVCKYIDWIHETMKNN